MLHCSEVGNVPYIKHFRWHYGTVTWPWGAILNTYCDLTYCCDFHCTLYTAGQRLIFHYVYAFYRQYEIKLLFRI